MDLEEIESGDVDWISLVQYRDKLMAVVKPTFEPHKMLVNS
jgi:hypothetical protein